MNSEHAVEMPSAAQQGMDPHNERKVFKELVSAATGARRSASHHRIAYCRILRKLCRAHIPLRIVAPNNDTHSRHTRADCT